MLNSMKYSIVSMLLVPRSTTLVTAPVRRSRWKRSDSWWRWRNTVRRQPPRRVLPDALEHRVAQIVEQRRRRSARAA